MNLGQLRTALQARGYGTDTATAQTAVINSVIRKIHGMHRWPWLLDENNSFSITAGTSSYSLSGSYSDIMHIDAIRVHDTQNYISLTPLERQAFQDLTVMNPGSSGPPMYWSRWNNTLYIWPTPDASYTLYIDYIKVPTDLSNDSDTPLIPATYQDVIVWGAIAEMAYRERDTADYDMAKQEYAARLGEMLDQYGMDQRQTSDRVVESGWHAQFDLEANPWLTY